MQLAARLQPLLIAIRSQVLVLRRAEPSDAAAAFDLTGRELAVLDLLATGGTASTIGWTLGCSRRTVEKHLEHIYRKLKVSDRVGAVRLAEAEGLLPGAFPKPWDDGRDRTRR